MGIALASRTDWLTDDGHSPIYPIYGVLLEEGSNAARASAVFRTKAGDVSLSSNGGVAVNGTPMTGEPIYKDSPISRTQIGYRYLASPRADGKRFEFHFTRAPNREYRHAIDIEPFSLTLPAVISKSKDLVIPVSGATLRQAERVFAYAEDISNGHRYRIDPVPRDERTWIIPATRLQRVSASRARIVIYRSYDESLPEFRDPANIGVVYRLRPIEVEIAQ